MIVESPHKARVIGGFLGSGWRVIATRGYMFEIRDAKSVPAGKKAEYGSYGVNVVDGSFDVLKQVIRGSGKTLKELRDLINTGEYGEFYVSTDPDRAGEQIGAEVVDWLALDLKRNNVRVLRASWHEITRSAVLDGVNHPGRIDMNMVHAAEARQIYDRLFGFTVSPYLWRTVGPKTSGGRAQSPALRLIVNREKERLAFRQATYAGVDGLFTIGDGNGIWARLTMYDGAQVATGSSFDSNGSAHSGVLVLDDDSAKDLVPRLHGASWSVSSVTSKPYTRKPPAPYTTSTMQQDIGNRLGLGTKRITDLAQMLYEHSFITYIRSDAPFLAPEAAIEARRIAVAKHGRQSVPSSGTRQYTAKGKNVQAGHEAIRPTLDDNGHFAEPSSIKSKLDKLDPKAYDFYRCVYNRTVASQMNDAHGTTSTVTITSNTIPTGGKGTASGEFAASGTIITSPGWMALTKPVSDDTGTDEQAFPDIHRGDEARLDDTRTSMHRTTPPARFTEPQLVAELEHRGIGRPATYSQIVMVNQERGYVAKHGKQLYPTFKGMQVAQILETMLPGFVDYDYTAHMEQHLDEIEQGKVKRNQWLSEAWNGPNGINTIITPLMNNVDWNLINKASTITINDGYEVRNNRGGAWLQRTNDGGTGNVPSVRVDDDMLSNGVPDTDALEELMTHATSAADGPNVLGRLESGPYAGWEISVRDGRNGEYIMARKLTRNGTPAKSTRPVFKSLPDDKDGSTITMKDVEPLFNEVALPRYLDDHFFTGIGKRGAYIGWKKTPKGRARFISMPDTMDPRTITLDEASAYWEENKPKPRGKH